MIVQPREQVLAVKGVVQQLEVEKFQGKDVHRAVDVGRVHDQRGGEALLAVFLAQRRQDIQKGQVHLMEHDDAVDLGGPFPVILGQDPAHQVDGIDLGRRACQDLMEKGRDFRLEGRTQVLGL